MDYYELLKFLDLEDPSEFIYFEAMADLVESEEYIEQEAVYALFEGADDTMIAELFEDYFEDILEGLPADSSGIYSLLHQIKMTLIGMAGNIEEESDLRRLTDEFCRFREWYVSGSDVELSPEDGGESIHQCLRDAITTARMEKLGGDRYRYSFEEAMDYELDSYTMSFAELAAAEDGYNDGTTIYDEDDLRRADDLILETGRGARHDN